jgi:hypothetical protein
MPDDLMSRARLQSQRLARGCATPGEAVESLCALQAQDYAWGLWAVGARVAPESGLATQEAVEQAIAQGQIVRSWPMRRTLHLLAAADVHWMLKLLAGRAVEQAAGRRRQLGIEEGELARSRELWSAALQGGKRLTRSAMLEMLEAGGLSPEGQRGYHLLVHHAQEGLLSLGPNEGKEQTYVLLDEWVPPAPPLDRDEALATLARRYFAGHGPATAHDLARWAYLPMGDVRKGLAAASADLERTTHEGVEYWMAPGALDAASESNVAEPPRVLLLAGFDEMVLGYKDRTATISAENEARIVPGGNGVFRPVLLVDGVVVAGWTRTLRRKGVTIDVEPFGDGAALLATHADALEQAARRYGDFLGLPATVQVQ